MPSEHRETKPPAARIARIVEKARAKLAPEYRAKALRALYDARLPQTIRLHVLVGFRALCVHRFVPKCARLDRRPALPWEDQLNLAADIRADLCPFSSAPQVILEGAGEEAAMRMALQSAMLVFQTYRPAYQKLYERMYGSRKWHTTCAERGLGERSYKVQMALSWDIEDLGYVGYPIPRLKKLTPATLPEMEIAPVTRFLNQQLELEISGKGTFD